MHTRAFGIVAALLLVACSVQEDSAPPAIDPASPTTTPRTAPLFDAETDTTLVMAPGYGPLYALDLDTGLAQRFSDTGGVPGDFLFRLTALADGVAYPGDGGVRGLPWSLQGRSELLGESYTFLPSGQPDRLWLVENGSPGDDVFPDAVREIDGRGHVTTSRVRLPAGTYPVRAVADAVVLDGEPGLRLFNPERPREVRRIEAQSFLAAAGDQLAVTDPCDGCVRLRVIDVVDDAAEDVVADLSGLPFHSAFSPDGRMLALWVSDGAEVNGGFQLVDLDTGVVQVVPGSTAGPYADVTWSSDGSWVFAVARRLDGEGAALVGYRLGAVRAEIRSTPTLQTGGVVTAPAGAGPDLRARAETGPCPTAVEPDDNTNPQAAVTADRPCRIRLDAPA